MIFMRPILLVYGKHSPFPHTIGMPLAIFTLGHYLEKRGFTIRYFDERVHKKSLLKEYIKENPLLIGTSTMTSYQIISSIKISKLARKMNKNIPIVWGGVHPSMVPKQTIKSEYVDFVVKGEGEETIEELADALSRNETDFSNIDGLVWKKDEEIIINKERKFMDFNKVPSPVNKFFRENLDLYLSKDTDITARHPVFYASSRGCPYNCVFCYNHYYHKNIWRPRNLDLVKKELIELKSFGVEKIFFADDNLGGNMKHLLGVCAIMKELGLKWSACLRINNIDKESVKILETSGCEYVLFGIESGSEEILKFINKGITTEQIKECIDLFAKSSMVPMYSFMFGFPNETDEDIKKSFALVDYIASNDSKAEIQLQNYTPFPGTPLYKMALEQGFEPPKNLKSWANMVMDEVNVPWVDKKRKRMLKNLYVISVFAFRNKEFLKNKIFYIPHLIAKWRWKKKYFKLSYERLAYDIVKLIPWLK